MSRITLTVVIRDNHGVDDEPPWLAEIATPHGSTALGFGESPTDAGQQALDAYRGAVALQNHLNREAP